MSAKQKLLFLITSVLCMIAAPFVGTVSTPSIAYGAGSPCYYDGKQFSNGSEGTNGCASGSAQTCNNGDWGTCHLQ